jgi:membrane-associated phospholipid phosphatase
VRSPLARGGTSDIVAILRWLSLALATVILVLTPESAAQDPSPPAAAEEADDFGVDVITAAGVDEGPPKRMPSIKSDVPELQVKWDPAWQRFELGNYIGTGIMLAATIGSLAIPPSASRWRQTNSFDVGARNALRLNSLSGRNTARDASDILLVVSTNWLVVDTLIVSWWGHDAGDVAWEVAMMSVEALAFNNAINGLVSAFASRQRPYGTDLCESEEGEKLRDCNGSKRYRSFFSGHSSTTFAVAGLTCMHHAHLPLYGGGAPDVMACASAFGIAAGTAALRVVGDQHWTSDVLVGAAFGTFSGLFIPWVLHYRTGDLPDKVDTGGVSFQVVPSPTGGSITGAF